MRGSRVDFEVEQKFRAHYLVSGNARAAAKAIGVPGGTGQELALRARVDPEFLQAREELKARTLPDAERIAFEALEVCAERLQQEAPDLEALLKDAPEGVKIQFMDPGPAYANSIAKLASVLGMNRKVERELTGGDNKPTEVRITMAGPEVPPPVAGAIADVVLGKVPT